MSRELPIPHVFARLLFRLLVGTMLLVAAPSAHAIVGPAGSVFKATDGQYPWTASIVVAGQSAVGNDPHFCGGTLIAANRVLTAAHCIDPSGRHQLTPSATEVILGQTSMCAGEAVSLTCPIGDITGFSQGTRLGVTSISVHPMADVEHYYDDVAILTLAGSVDPAHAVPLVDESGQDAVDNGTPATAGAWGPGTRLYAFGWGTTCWNCGQANVLRWTGGGSINSPQLPRQADTTCGDLSRYGADFRARDMLCAGKTTGNTTVPDSCRGDSGGPLLKLTDSSLNATQIASTASAWRLVGVVSWGPSDCGLPQFPGVYARVGAAELRDFISNPEPPSMPTPAAAPAGPSVTGFYQQNGTITCNAGEWTGATSFTFKMWKDADNDGERDNSADYWEDSTIEPYVQFEAGATSATYKVTSSDLAAKSRPSIGCQVIARGPGGYAGATTPVMADTSIHDVPQSVAQTPTTPTPTPTAAPVADTAAPIISKSSTVCASASCRVALVVIDRGSVTTTAGIGSVTFTLYLRRKTTCAVKSGTRRGTRRPCTKTVKKAVRAKRSIDQYVLQLTKLRRADRPKLRAVAVDQAGNRSTLSIALPLRATRR